MGLQRPRQKIPVSPGIWDKRLMPPINSRPGSCTFLQDFNSYPGTCPRIGILHCPSKVVYTFLRRAIEIEIEIGIAIVIEMK